MDKRKCIMKPRPDERKVPSSTAGMSIQKLPDMTMCDHLESTDTITMHMINRSPDQLPRNLMCYSRVRHGLLPVERPVCQVDLTLDSQFVLDRKPVDRRSENRK